MPTETERLWLAAWRRAGPELERIRREELRNLPETPQIEASENPATSDAREKASSGLVAWQQWMMRLRILELRKQLRSHDSP
ncbi:MAG UNVERIFIED_CONTAM: hypothetical protein LVR18_22030 [Planctomycetaceae bacterium]|jgi:hypothetical protein